MLGTQPDHTPRLNNQRILVVDQFIRRNSMSILGQLGITRQVHDIPFGELDLVCLDFHLGGTVNRQGRDGFYVVLFKDGINVSREPGIF